MKAEIIAVGTEILVGDIVNTNAQFLSRELFNLGIDMYYQTVAGDNPLRLTEAIRLAFGRADMVIFSGGLGPTEDDLTKETVAEYFDVPLLFHEEIKDEIKEYLKGYAKNGYPESNWKQAYIPEGAMILHNQRGTAPGIILEKNGKIAVLLPGPPRELLPMFTEQVVPYLRAKSDFVMESKVVRLFGIGEAKVGEIVCDLMEGSNPTVAPYAKDNEVTLRIAAKGETKEQAEALIETVQKEIENRLGDYIYGYDEENMPRTTAALLMERQLTVACAESCTAGLLTAMLGDIPGISSVLSESVVTYSNEAKMKYLGVLPETLASFGAVSEETAREMAEGIRKTASSDIGVSVTGIAGPDGGTPEKPVGLVYVGVSYRGEVTVKKLNLHGDRTKVRRGTVMHALNAVRECVLKNER
ncbi:MAG: competence/damage-inducible protein A [Ruminococcaceae bacterium]|nr:competence/damage-inducible protein A [Oscillospiraceae bacterium]